MKIVAIYGFDIEQFNIQVPFFIRLVLHFRITSYSCNVYPYI